MNFNLTMLGQFVSFGVFIWLTMKYVWPPIMEVLETRQKTIEEGLNAANRAEEDLRLAQEEVDKAISEAKTQAAEIIEQANKRANQIVDAAKDDARVEAERIKAAARAEIEQDVQQAREALRGKVSQLVLVGTEKILEKSVDQGAHAEMLDKLASEL